MISALNSLLQLKFPSSNIPIILISSKLTMCLNQFLFKLHKGQFTHIMFNRRIRFQHFLAIFLFLLHCVLPLKWFFFNWMFPSNPPVANWELIIMGYSFCIFLGSLIAVDQFNRLETETRLLLNSSMKIEKDCRDKGGLRGVCLYYVN